MKFQKQYLWLAVTADEYELPLAVEDTAARIPSEQWNTAEKMKGIEEREKDRCRALESGTRSGKWR